jgi:hypothetical protein
MTRKSFGGKIRKRGPRLAIKLFQPRTVPDINRTIVMPNVGLLIHGYPGSPYMKNVMPHRECYDTPSSTIRMTCSNCPRQPSCGGSTGQWLGIMSEVFGCHATREGQIFQADAGSSVNGIITAHGIGRFGCRPRLSRFGLREGMTPYMIAISLNAR